MTQQNPLKELAQAAHHWGSCDLDAAVVHDTRRAVLDWFAALLPGCAEGPAVMLAPALASGRGTGAAVAYV